MWRDAIEEIPQWPGTGCPLSESVAIDEMDPVLDAPGNSLGGEPAIRTTETAPWACSAG